jgi:Zn ribbon nucleic-acid-binding protein
MKIKTILSQYRRDFTATLECEHCGNEDKLSSGYDDAHYHQNVIPNLECSKCKKAAPESYRPLTTKYPAGYQV